MTLIGPKTIFIILFITLGPVKLIGPFAALTATADRKEKRRSAVNIFALSTILTLGVALAGRPIAWQWGISREAVMITTGSILFVWALLSLLEYRTVHAYSGEQLHSINEAIVFPLTIPATIPPAGIAAVLLFTMRPDADWAFMGVFILLLLAVMVLNLLAMLEAENILKMIGGIVTLKITAAVLLVMQIALAVEVLLNAIQTLAGRD